MDFILRTLYGLPHPNRTRTRPMKVLAVGISRSGTESLRNALVTLGYPTYHGFDSIVPPPTLEAWHELMLRKYANNLVRGEAKITAADFDRIIGNYAAITDLPAARFAVDLIEAYPEAKVILNVRKDLDAWYKSFDETMGYFDRNPVDWDWCKSWFSADLFWIRHHMCRFVLPHFFRGSFRSNGKWVYREHVAMIKGLGLPPERLLEWSVEDGWGPLCKFLGEDVPDEPFPNGNAPKEWAERIGTTMAEHHRRAVRNMILTGTAIVGVAAAIIMRGRSNGIAEVVGQALSSIKHLFSA